MNARSICGGLLIAGLLASGSLTGESWASDTKDKMPKHKSGNQPSQPTARPAESGAKPQDNFVDRDNNGVDDRHESRALRPEPTAPPPVVKKQEPPPAQAPAKPAEPAKRDPAAKKPPTH